MHLSIILMLTLAGIVIVLLIWFKMKGKGKIEQSTLTFKDIGEGNISPSIRVIKGDAIKGSFKLKSKVSGDLRYLLFTEPNSLAMTKDPTQASNFNVQDNILKVNDKKIMFVVETGKFGIADKGSPLLLLERVTEAPPKQYYIMVSGGADNIQTLVTDSQDETDEPTMTTFLEDRTISENYWSID